MILSSDSSFPAFRCASSIPAKRCKLFTVTFIILPKLRRINHLDDIIFVWFVAAISKDFVVFRATRTFTLTKIHMRITRYTRKLENAEQTKHLILFHVNTNWAIIFKSWHIRMPLFNIFCSLQPLNASCCVPARRMKNIMEMPWKKIGALWN